MAKDDFLDTPQFIEESQKINQIALNPSRSTSGPASWTNPRTSATYTVASGGDLALAKKIRDDRSNVFGVLDLVDDILTLQTDVGILQTDVGDLQTDVGNLQTDKQDISSGATLARPETPILGQMYFDTDLGIPIWWNGTIWVNATGTDADL